MHYACINNKKSYALKFLINGADLNAKHKGDKPKDIAIKRNSLECLELIEKFEKGKLWNRKINHYFFLQKNFQTFIFYLLLSMKHSLLPFKNLPKPIIDVIISFCFVPCVIEPKIYKK